MKLQLMEIIFTTATLAVLDFSSRVTPEEKQGDQAHQSSFGYTSLCVHVRVNRRLQNLKTLSI